MTSIQKRLDCPLVSVIVITYNSSKYVLETLESIKRQTYSNIELIISDDCSVDNTIELCKKWLQENENHFISTQVIETKKNTGIAPNCNRGLFVANGEWIKFIAGDDLLMDDCLAININHVKNSNHSFFFSRMKYINENKMISKHFVKSFELLNKTDNQLRVLLKSNHLPAPSSFIRRKTLIKLNGFDERFPMIEDYPMWLKASKNQYILVCFDIPTVIYRISDEGVSRNRKVVDKKEFYNDLLFRTSAFNIRKKILIKELIYNYMFLSALSNFIKIIYFYIIINVFNNKRNFVSESVYNILSIFNPYFYYNLFKRRNN